MLLTAQLKNQLRLLRTKFRKYFNRKERKGFTQSLITQSFANFAFYKNLDIQKKTLRTLPFLYKLRYSKKNLAVFAVKFSQFKYVKFRQLLLFHQ